MRKIRAGVVGVGYLGRFHALKYAAMPEVVLAGVADIDKKRAEAVAAECKAPAFTRHEDLFSRVDAVSIAVPTALHYRVGRDFLKNGVGVLMEKPIAGNLKEAQGLIGLAEAGGLVLQVGHLERFNPALRAAQPLLNKPFYMEAHRLSLFKPRALNVSVVLDLMIHDIDIVLALNPGRLKSLWASGSSLVSPYADMAAARLEFENGCVANITASRVSEREERTLRIFQDDGCLAVDFKNRSLTIIRPKKKGRKTGPPEMNIKETAYAGGDILESEIASFVRCVATRGEPLVSGRAGKRALSVALKIENRIRLRKSA
jgi:predicted dehydrogenase